MENLEKRFKAGEIYVSSFTILWTVKSLFSSMLRIQFFIDIPTSRVFHIFLPGSLAFISKRRKIIGWWQMRTRPDDVIIEE
jgi:hypothetical protein